MTRLEANRQILSLLSSYFEAYPDLRFGQGLSNLNIATHVASYAMNENEELEKFFQDIYFEEPSDLAARLPLKVGALSTDSLPRID